MPSVSGRRSRVVDQLPEPSVVAGPVTACAAVSVTVMLIAEWVVFQRAPRVAAVATFFHLSTLGAVLVSGFWSIINEQLDAQTAKRHIGRVGMAATIGGIAGGLVAERAAVYLEPGAILLVLAGVGGMLWRRYQGGQGPGTPGASGTPGTP